MFVYEIQGVQNKYDEFTKPGLKVFHLQRISSTSYEESELMADDRYIKLKSEIFTPEKMKALSPAQIIAAAVSLGRLRGSHMKEWTVICNAIKNLSESSQYRISASQIGVTLYAIARSGNCGCAKDRFVVPVLKRFLQESNEWSPIDMGWVLYFLRRRESRSLASWHRTAGQLAYRFNERLGDMTGKQIACILSEFGYMKLSPNKAINGALTALESRKKKLDAKTMCLLLGSFAKLRIYRTDFLFKVSPEILFLISEPKKSTFRQVATILFHLSKLDWFNAAIVKAVLKRFDDSGEISDVDLAMIAYGLGRLGVGSCTATWTRIARELSERLESMSALNVSVIVSSFGKVGYADATLMESVLSHVRANIKAFTSRQTLTLLSGLMNCHMTHLSVPLPKNMQVDHVTEFQLNKLRLNYSVSPIMAPRKISFLHSKIKDLLHANGLNPPELNKQVGPVFVDAYFDLEGMPSAILLLGASDVCKLNTGLLLGPTSWIVRYLDRVGIQVFSVHREALAKADSLAAIPGLERFGTTFNWCKRAPRLPFHFDHQNGKVSFSNSYLGFG